MEVGSRWWTWWSQLRHQDSRTHSWRICHVVRIPMSICRIRWAITSNVELMSANGPVVIITFVIMLYWLSGMGGGNGEECKVLKVETRLMFGAWCDSFWIQSLLGSQVGWEDEGGTIETVIVIDDCLDGIKSKRKLCWWISLHVLEGDSILWWLHQLGACISIFKKAFHVYAKYREVDITIPIAEGKLCELAHT